MVARSAGRRGALRRAGGPRGLRRVLATEVVAMLAPRRRRSGEVPYVTGLYASTAGWWDTPWSLGNMQFSRTSCSHRLSLHGDVLARL